MAEFLCDRGGGEIISSLSIVGHIGYLVEDVYKSAEKFTALCGISDFKIYDFIPKKAWSYGIEIYDCHFKIALSQGNHTPKIELIEPISGEKTPHIRYLKERGQNIHHIAYYVDNYNYWYEKYNKLNNAKIIFETWIEDNVLGKRQSFYVIVNNEDIIVEIVGMGIEGNI
jgi:hypothetical protein